MHSFSHVEGLLICVIIVWAAETVFIPSDTTSSEAADSWLESLQQFKFSINWPTIIARWKFACQGIFALWQSVSVSENRLHHSTIVKTGVVVPLLADVDFHILFNRSRQISCIAILFSHTFNPAYSQVAVHFQDRVLVAYSDGAHTRLNGFLFRRPDSAGPWLVLIENQEHFVPIMDQVSLEIFDSDTQTRISIIDIIERFLSSSGRVPPATFQVGNSFDIVQQRAAMFSAMGANRTVIDDFITDGESSTLVALINGIGITREDADVGDDHIYSVTSSYSFRNCTSFVCSVQYLLTQTTTDFHVY